MTGKTRGCDAKTRFNIFGIYQKWYISQIGHKHVTMDAPVNETNPTLSNGYLTITVDELIYKKRKIRLADVTAIRYGWLPIELDMYAIGGRYRVELKTSHQKLKIEFPYYFGLFKKRQSSNFQVLIDTIWDITVIRLLNTMTKEIEDGKSVGIGKCTVDANGILCKNFLIRWDDLSYQKNYNRLTINSVSNPNTWTNLYYTEVDNVHVLTRYLEWKLAANKVFSPVEGGEPVSS